MTEAPISFFRLGLSYLGVGLSGRYFTVASSHVARVHNRLQRETHKSHYHRSTKRYLYLCMYKAFSVVAVNKYIS